MTRRQVHVASLKKEEEDATLNHATKPTCAAKPLSKSRNLFCGAEKALLPHVMRTKKPCSRTLLVLSTNTQQGLVTNARTASGLDKHDVGLMPRGERLARPQVGADVFPDGCVGAPPGFDGKNSAVRESEQQHARTRVPSASSKKWGLDAWGHGRGATAGPCLVIVEENERSWPSTRNGGGSLPLDLPLPLSSRMRSRTQTLAD